MADGRIKAYWSKEMEALLDTYNQFQTLIPAQGREGSAHVGEDGRYVEYLIKEYLKRYLPRDLEALTGFILRPAVKCGHNDKSRCKDEHEASSQLDILIADTAHFPVYQRFGDSVILPPEGVAGIISVKKHLRRKDLAHECEMLAQASSLCPHLRSGKTDEKKLARSPFTALLTIEDAFDEGLKKPMTTKKKRNEAYKKLCKYYQDKKSLYYDEMVDFVGALSSWGIYKERPQKPGETFYLGFEFQSGHESAGFQMILQGILDVYYANMPSAVVRPGFTDNSGEGYAEKQGPIFITVRILFGRNEEFMLNLINMENLKKLHSLSKRYTFRELYIKTREKLSSPYRDYSRHYLEYLPTDEELTRQRENPLKRQPLVSIVVPTYETPELFLRQMVDSVIAQTYENWELCIADGSKSDRVGQVIKAWYTNESRIRYWKLEKNGGISENTNQGISHASGEYLALLDHDDLLVPSALYEMARCANETGADMLYSDEDKVVGNLERYQDPHFKLDYNEELLMGNNYICHFLMFTRELFNKVGGLDERYDGAQDFDFVLRCSQQAQRIEHVRKILYHWRIHEGSTAGRVDSKLYAYEAGKRAVEAALERQGVSGSVTMTKDYGFFQIQYPVPENILLEVQAWGECSQSWEKVQEKLERELGVAGISTIWKEISKPEEYINRKTRIQIDEEEPQYILRINRSVARVGTADILRLVGSCARPDVMAVSAKVICGGKVLNCGFYKKKGRYHPRFMNLPADFKGYFRRAILAAEVDAIGNDLTIIHSKNQAGRMIVEPAAIIEIKK